MISGKAYANITKRVLGEDIPLLNFDNEGGLFSKLRNMIKFGN